MITTKICTKCGLEKPLEQFHMGYKAFGVRRPDCAECHKEQVRQYRQTEIGRAKAREYSRRMYARKKEYSRDFARNHREKIRDRKWGFSPGEYDKLVQSQNGKCAVCGQEKRLNIDHDHQTGRVRGLLCTGCNTFIGFLETKKDYLEEAARYLARAKT